MIRFHRLLFLLAFVAALSLVAFRGQSEKIAPASEPNHPAFQAPTTPTPAVAGRTATIKEIQNNVQARATAATDFLQATLNLLLGVGGQVRTGQTSKTRIDFSEGTIVRLGDNTLL